MATAKKNKKQQAAKKAWDTRRKNAQKRKRRQAALRAWDTRRQHEYEWWTGTYNGRP